jgi:polysaccharide deacetylase family protein (PEP-CTERM system associated)
MTPLFLPAIDLEDPRSLLKDGACVQDRVPENTDRLLALFRDGGVRATFFVAGEVARRHPALVARIAAGGHEIASHGWRHRPLDRLSPSDFEAEVRLSREALQRACAGPVQGFRAPWFSLTARTAWAHAVLSRAGFAYSSSVLPARNPLYGWPKFGNACRRVAGGLWEVPVTVGPWAGAGVPFGGGVYFRLLPLGLIRRLARRAGRATPVAGYLHPYDIDEGQERFRHAGLAGGRLFHWFLYHGRARALDKYRRFLSQVRTMTYGDFVRERLESGGPQTQPCQRS